MCAGYPAWPMTGDQSGTDEIFMAAQEAVGAVTGQQRDSQGRHEWLTRFIIMVFTMVCSKINLHSKPLDLPCYLYKEARLNILFSIFNELKTLFRPMLAFPFTYT